MDCHGESLNVWSEKKTHYRSDIVEIRFPKAYKSKE